MSLLHNPLLNQKLPQIQLTRKFRDATIFSSHRILSS